MPPDTFCGLQILLKSFVAGALPWTPLGELTTLPQTPSRLGIPHPSRRLRRLAPRRLRRLASAHQPLAVCSEKMSLN